MIAIIDYDMGNLRSVSKAFETAGAQTVITRDPHVIANASKVVLPGVGAFGKCMENLENYQLIQPIKDSIQSGKWFLGICLGLQLLFDESEEFGPVKGLGIIKGQVKKFDRTDPKKEGGKLTVPQIGWNQIIKNGAPLLFKNIPDHSHFYFVHSFYVVPTDANLIATQTDYGRTFCSSIQKDNVLATQFHPEKSQKLGLQVLENFIKL